MSNKKIIEFLKTIKERIGDLPSEQDDDDMDKGDWVSVSDYMRDQIIAVIEGFITAIEEDE